MKALKELLGETSVKVRLSIFKREDYQSVIDDAMIQAFELGKHEGKSKTDKSENSKPS